MNQALAVIWRYHRRPGFAAITANVLRSMNVPPDSSVTSIIPDNSVQESM
jgi:cell division protein FtsI (penicillin-binding protein 3)